MRVTILAVAAVKLTAAVTVPVEGEEWWRRSDLVEAAKPWTDADSGRTVFSPRQQELFGVDKYGKLVDPGQFEVAVDAIREVPAVKATPRTEADNIAIVQAASQKKECLEVDVAYLPFDMPGQMMTYTPGWVECQERCAALVGCKHFTWSPVDKGCHVTDSTYRTLGAFGSTAGPPTCPEDEEEEEKKAEAVQEYEVVGHGRREGLGAISGTSPQDGARQGMVNTFFVALAIFAFVGALSVWKWMQQQKHRSRAASGGKMSVGLYRSDSLSTASGESSWDAAQDELAEMDDELMKLMV